jgi:hypothetical protein
MQDKIIQEFPAVQKGWNSQFPRVPIRRNYEDPCGWSTWRRRDLTPEKSSPSWSCIKTPTADKKNYINVLVCSAQIIRSTASTLQFGNNYFVNKTNEKTTLGSSFAEFGAIFPQLHVGLWVRTMRSMTLLSRKQPKSVIRQFHNYSCFQTAV